MTQRRIKENLIHRKDIVLKDTTSDLLEEVEYLHAKKCYNETGKLISETEYSDSGLMLQETINNFNDNGLLIEEITRDGDGEVLEHKRFEYDPTGKVIKEFRYYMDDTFDTTFYHYTDGILTKKECVDFDGEVESTEECSVENGLVVAKSVKDADGEIVHEQKMTYDAKNRVVSLYDVNSSDNKANRKTEYEYYESGNKKSILVFNGSDELIERTLFDEDEKGQIIRVEEETTKKKNTTSFTFDERGNILFQEERDMKGQVVSRLERVYNDQNEIMSSTVFISGENTRISKNYTLRQEYHYFD